MEKIAVIGAGLVGSLHAVYLSKNGFDVDVYERREDLRKYGAAGGRSINLALSDRGWKALEGVGLGDEIKNISIPMHGRMMHAVDGTLTSQPYGKEGQAIYSVSRGDLNLRMLNVADENPDVDLYFDQKCEDINLKTNEIKFKNTETGETSIKKYDRIFATDGAFSSSRLRLQKTDRFNFSQFYLKHGYKELHIPPNADGTHKLEKNYLHIWPRGNFMLIALPNMDGSFTVTLFLGFEGDVSFEKINTKEEVLNFFETYFADVIPLIPELVEDYFDNPTSSLITIKCEPWNYKDKVLLMGDSSHAIVPFYGQGMNSGFEDCSVFDDFFQKHNGDWTKIFPEFAEHRKPDADAISDLAMRNFVEMRDLTGDPMFLLQKKIERKFANAHPDKWMPLYSQVTFSHIRYSEALAEGKRQDKIMEQIMSAPNIEEIWDSEEVENKMLSLIETM